MFRSVIKLLRTPLTDLNSYNVVKSDLPIVTRIPEKYLHTSTNLLKTDDKKQMIASMPTPDEGTEGEKLVDIDTIVTKGNMFPDENTPNQLFNGVPFKELPIVNIRATPNNTIISVTTHKGVLKILKSCGVEGFKNARKGTNIAAQATAISLSTKALEEGYKTVRVAVRGIGPGRMSAIKGLQMGGMDIVSVTDNTRVTWAPRRARKARRL